MIRFVVNLCDLLLEKGAGGYWYYNMTPLPFSYPTIEQYIEGIEWALGRKDKA
jgi:hypothetical protein